MAGIVKFLQIILFYILSYLGLTQCAFKVADCETTKKKVLFLVTPAPKNATWRMRAEHVSS